ncbi:unnamed protein product [Lactuca saligna]|uniref:TF-B3 domain-containing protein n=1 Tax=Lactuca saligna TaxID=75948 RepID=A0AA36DYL7_LACSI|nr:unnamed protein product [Lactuca saligna]
MDTERSSEPKQGSPSFFKVVRYPSSPHLSLPIAFVRRYLHKIPKNTILKTATGEHSWRLKIKQIGEDYCFAHGWEKLAQDVQLAARDILVFWLVDSFTFQVSFFDEHGCEKDLPLTHTSDDDEDDGQHHDDDDDVAPYEDLYFQKVICERNHRYYMGLPKKFVDSAGLENKSSIKMKDKEGKEWKIGLKIEIYSNIRVYLASGWPHFRQYHDLCNGDMCLFKYIKKENVLILVEMIKSKRPTKRQSSDVKGLNRKVGRPPVEKLDGGGGGGGGGVKVKVEYESGPEAEVVKRKRGRSPVERQLGGGVEVKIEDGLWPEVGVVKKKRGAPPLGEPCGGGGGGGGVKVKIEDESCPAELEVVMRNKGGPMPVKARVGGEVKARAGGGDVKPEQEMESLFRCKQVIYF